MREGKKMSWLVNTLKSSIGKKLMMALTGLCFIGFLTVHLGGNLTLYGGKDLFNAYAHNLHSLGALIVVSELGLLFLALVHVATGVILFFKNLAARPNRYHFRKSAGGRTLGSATMPYTGIIILGFLIFHLINFHFVDKTNTTIYQIVAEAFANPVYVFIYLVAMTALAFHISHGFWSLFQTLGANHPKYLPLIKGAGFVASLIFGVGFGIIPVYMAFIS
jgi:succinate dehydrogenase / fumarate reductase cytochrome b subunit